MMELATELVDHLKDTYQDLPPQSKPILLGILSDKIRDLTSEGGSVVQHQHVHINHNDLNALMSGTKKWRQQGRGVIRLREWYIIAETMPKMPIIDQYLLYLISAGINGRNTHADTKHNFGGAIPAPPGGGAEGFIS